MLPTCTRAVIRQHDINRRSKLERIPDDVTYRMPRIAIDVDTLRTSGSNRKEKNS